MVGELTAYVTAVVLVPEPPKAAVDDMVGDQFGKFERLDASPAPTFVGYGAMRQ